MRTVGVGFGFFLLLIGIYLVIDGAFEIHAGLGWMLVGSCTAGLGAAITGACAS